MQGKQSEDRQVTPGLIDLARESFSAFGKQALEVAGSAMLGFARFSGLIIDTKISDMALGLREGGSLSLRRTVENYRGAPEVNLIRLRNDLVSVIYRCSSERGERGMELRETVDIVRKDLPGGAILLFTDGELVGGNTNAVRRVYFQPDERDDANKILKIVRDRVAKKS